MADEIRRGTEPAAWMIRAGRDGEREEKALNEGLVIVGWDNLDDIGDCRTREEIRERLHRAYPDAAKNAVANWTGQLWRLVKQIGEGDLAVMPMKTHHGKIAIGHFIGPYEYREEEPPGFRHVRKVDWIRTDIAVEVLRPDLRASMGSLLTICRLSRNDAARRIAHLAAHGIDPGLDGDEEITTSDELLEDAVSRDSADPRRLTIRSFLEHWGFQRRTGTVVAVIKSDLADKGLTTRPPFTEGSIESEIALVPLGAEPGSDINVVDDIEDTEDVSETQHMTLRLGNLPAPLLSVSSTASLTYAKTLMLERKFSQLAVIGEEETCHGAISWESIGKAHVASDHPTLEDAIIPAFIVDHDALLLDQISVIYERGYIFVRHADRVRVTGIITASDLTRQFGDIARPFVLIEEAENRLRRAADEVFQVEELRESVAQHQRNRIHRAADLTFGNYSYLLKPSERWETLGWNIDQPLFLDRLEEVRKVRNELMHFTPDPLSAEKYAAVHGLLELLRTVDPRP
jgi:restriction system protein